MDCVTVMKQIFLSASLRRRLGRLWGSPTLPYNGQARDLPAGAERPVVEISLISSEFRVYICWEVSLYLHSYIRRDGNVNT
jgi:hypothetical protein